MQACGCMQAGGFMQVFFWLFDAGKLCWLGRLAEFEHRFSGSGLKFYAGFGVYSFCGFLCVLPLCSPPLNCTLCYIYLSSKPAKL